MAQLYVTSISRSIIKIFAQNSKIKYLFLLFVIISFHGKSQDNNKVINYTLYFKFDIKYFVSIKNEKILYH
jgi:hypothetical protein